jgi:hypothetical protein
MRKRWFTFTCVFCLLWVITDFTVLFVTGTFPDLLWLSGYAAFAFFMGGMVVISVFSQTALDWLSGDWREKK